MASSKARDIAVRSGDGMAKSLGDDLRKKKPTLLPLGGSATGLSATGGPLFTENSFLPAVGQLYGPVRAMSIKWSQSNVGNPAQLETRQPESAALLIVSRVRFGLTSGRAAMQPRAVKSA
jgi:hypothetical protein